MRDAATNDPGNAAVPASPNDDAARLPFDADLLRTVIEASNRAFFLIDPRTLGLLYISPLFERIWQRPRSEWYEDNTRWFDTIYPADRKQCEEAAERRLLDESTNHPPFDYRIVRPDGSLRWIRGNVFRCRHPSDGSMLLCGVAEDVTTAKEAEQAAQRDRAELEAAVARRTAELTEAIESLRGEIKRRGLIERRMRKRTSFLRKLIHAQEWERKLVSFDVHDGAVQRLIGADMHLQTVLESVAADRMRSELEQARRLVLEALDESRRIMNGMRPQAVAELGAGAAVRELIEEYVRDGVDVEFIDQIGDLRWSPLIEMTIFRIVQESLSNALRQGGANRARVELRVENGRIIVVVADDGRAPSPASASRSEFGLRSIRERCAAVGGGCRIETAPGGGTTVYADLPELDPTELAAAARRRAEEAMRRDRRRLLSIIDRTAAAIFVKDAEGRYEIVNRRCEEFFHLTRAEIIGKTDYELFPPEVADAVRENDRRVRETGEPLTIEERVPGDGEIREYVSLKFLVPGESGKPPSVCGIATDITEHNRRLRALEDSQNRFRVFMEHLPILAWIKTVEGRYVFANRRTLEVHDWRLGDVIDRTDFDLFPHDVARTLTAHDAEVLEAGEARCYDEVAPVSDGPPVLWRSCKFPLVASDGTRLVGGVGFELGGELRSCESVQRRDARDR